MRKFMAAKSVSDRREVEAIYFRYKSHFDTHSSDVVYLEVPITPDPLLSV